MSYQACRWAAHVTAGADGRPLTGFQKLVLFVLAEWADARTHACWPAVASIARRACIAERTVRATLRELEQRGLIRTEIAAGRRTSRYMLNVSNPAARAGFKERSTRQQPPGSTRQEMPLNPASDDTQPGSRRHSTRHDVPPRRSRGGHRGGHTHTARETRAERVPPGDPDFEQFWQRYPRKIGKGQARRAFATALRKTSLTDMLRALDRARWPDDPRFVPHPATWLNGERWSDDPKAVASSVPPRRQHDTAADRMRALFPDGIADDPFGGTTVETTFTEEQPDE